MSFVQCSLHIGQHVNPPSTYWAPLYTNLSLSLSLSLSFINIHTITQTYSQMLPLHTKPPLSFNVICSVFLALRPTCKPSFHILSPSIYLSLSLSLSLAHKERYSIALNKKTIWAMKPLMPAQTRCYRNWTMGYDFRFRVD